MGTSCLNAAGVFLERHPQACDSHRSMAGIQFLESMSLPVTESMKWLGWESPKLGWTCSHCARLNDGRRHMRVSISSIGYSPLSCTLNSTKNFTRSFWLANSSRILDPNGRFFMAPKSRATSAARLCSEAGYIHDFILSPTRDFYHPQTMILPIILWPGPERWDHMDWTNHRLASVLKHLVYR